MKRLRSWRFRRIALIHKPSEGSLLLVESTIRQKLFAGLILGIVLSFFISLGAFLKGFGAQTTAYLVFFSFIFSGLAVPLEDQLVSYKIHDHIQSFFRDHKAISTITE